MKSGPGGEPVPERFASLVPLGVIVTPHGVHGEVRVRPYNPASTLLEEQRTVWLRERAGVRDVTVRAAHRHKAGLVVRIAGCDTRDAAETLRGAELCVPREALPPLAQGEVYVRDLVGLEARTPAGDMVGVVESVIAYPAATVLCVRGADGVREVPAAPPYLLAVRPEDGRVTVDRLGELDVLHPARRTRGGGE
jgi:16S rRNA processing protein RimM